MQERLARVADGMTEHEVKAILGEPTNILKGKAAAEYDNVDTVFAYRDPYRQHTTHYFGFCCNSLQFRLREIVGS